MTLLTDARPGAVILSRLQRAAGSLRAAIRDQGVVHAAALTLRTLRRKGPLLLRHGLASLRARRVRQGLHQQRQAAPQGPPLIAVAMTGGIGDFLVIARFLRDLQASIGDAVFDVFCPRPELATWALARIPGFRQAHCDILFDGLREHYDVALRANQMVVVHPGTLNWTMLRDRPGLAAIVSRLMAQRPSIDAFVQNHPWHDNFLAQRAVFGGHARRDYLHHLAGLPYGGDRLDIAQDLAAPQRFGLEPGTYVTVHNGFDTDFIIANRRATKCYPHFDAVLRRLKSVRPDLRFVQLGTTTSEPIAGCDAILLGRTTMEEVAALLANSLLHLDNEGGLVHLAAALGTRSAVVFGPTPVDYFGYPGNINIAPPVCGGCWWMNRDWMDRCGKGHAEPPCMHDQAPEAVAARILPTLAAYPARHWDMAEAAE